MRVYFIAIISLISLMNSTHSNASAVLDLDGQYSLEGMWMRNSLLDDDSGKFYFLHQLRLKPEIKVVDALSVYGRFDLLSNPWNHAFKYKGGNFLGSDMLDSSQSSFLRPSLDITHLYFGWSNELVKLMGGRMPSKFGLGLLFDAGEEPLDHFSDHLDGIGVQFKIGNLEIHPSFGILREGLNGSADAYEFLIKMQYELMDSGLLFGLMYDTRFSAQGGRQLSYGPLIPHSQEHLFFPRDVPFDRPDRQLEEVGRWGIQTIGTYVKKDLPFGSVSLEADFIFSSTIGLRAGDSQSSDSALELSGYGIVAEFASHPSPWDWGLKVGYLSGDDPETNGKYEGFIANRNYNVGMLMFNHAIGYQDTTGGSYRIHPPYNNPQPQLSSDGQMNSNRAYWPDVEYLTNVLFIAPSLKKSLFSKGYLTTNVLWAKLIQPSIWSEGTNLGFEVDVGFMYESSRYLTLAVQTGFLFPGAGFVGQSKKMVYGVQASAAVSF